MKTGKLRVTTVDVSTAGDNLVVEPEYSNNHFPEFEDKFGVTKEEPDGPFQNPVLAGWPGHSWLIAISAVQRAGFGEVNLGFLISAQSHVNETPPPHGQCKVRVQLDGLGEVGNGILMFA